MRPGVIALGRRIKFFDIVSTLCNIEMKRGKNSKWRILLNLISTYTDMFFFFFPVSKNVVQLQ